jgi:hypothetical protein
MPCHRQGSLTVGWRSPGKDEFYIFRHMTGQDLSSGQILAEKGQKGVTRAIHAQGWYFFNKLTAHSAEVRKVTETGTNQICIPASTRVFSSTSTREVAEHFRY